MLQGADEKGNRRSGEGRDPFFSGTRSGSMGPGLRWDDD
jgi:hypothetical protein